MNLEHKKPQPLYVSTLRVPCPVCGHVSYSPAGIHPQCAMRAADLIQISRIKARKLAEAQTAPTLPKRYEKQCPKCRTIQHVRQQICSCGHSFQFKNEDIGAL